MRTSSSIQSLCRSTKAPLFSSKVQSLSVPCDGFIFPGTKLKLKLSKVLCHSLSDSDKLSSPITLPANLVKLDGKSTSNNNAPKTGVLKKKAESFGIVYDDSCVPGCFYNLLCPKCKGGQSMERSLSFHIVLSGEVAMWRCFRFDCGWAGRVYADNREVDNRAKRKLKSAESLTEESLGLIPLGDELMEFFRERMISEETLHRNRVMQLSEDKPTIAFTYRRQGLIVSCKYRTIAKRFWREKDTEKILYGLADIVDSDEIIIVEGELDKLSMEEAGFRNCVSVPDGAPIRVSKILPPPEMDIKFKYLWSDKEYLDKASRIILATDGDQPGQALAEELAQRLGKDRCWKVSWPNKDEYSCFKDANEVLRYMGPSALKNVIERAELYQPMIVLDEQDEQA